MTRRAWLGTMAAAPVVLGLTSSVATDRAWSDKPPRELIRRRKLPNVELTTHEGRRVRFYDDLVRDRKVVINFMYAHCEGICLPVTHNLVQVQRLLGDRVGRDLHFYSITLKLARYAAANGVGPGWSFLTGRRSDCELLRRRLGFTDPDPVLDADPRNHAGNVLYGNEPLMLWAACPGQASATWIAKSILAQVDRPVHAMS
jgi:protein SCO1/2